MKMKLNLIGILLCSVFAGCGDKKHSDAHKHEDHAMSGNEEIVVTEAQFQVDETFQKQLSEVFDQYVKLKEAFVESEVELVKKETTALSQAVAKVDMKLLTGAAHNDWMTFLSPIQNSMNEIQASMDLEEQRRSFSTLSDNLYKSIRAFGLGGKEAYYEYCPMAFNNEGAYWLSDQEKIRNPYFGDKMLTCGMVKEKLK